MDTTAIVNVNTKFDLNFLALPKNIFSISNRCTLFRWTECIRQVRILVVFFIGPNMSAKFTEMKSSVHSRTISGFINGGCEKRRGRKKEGKKLLVGSTSFTLLLGYLRGHSFDPPFFIPRLKVNSPGKQMVGH